MSWKVCICWKRKQGLSAGGAASTAHRRPRQPLPLPSRPLGRFWSRVLPSAARDSARSLQPVPVQLGKERPQGQWSQAHPGDHAPQAGHSASRHPGTRHCTPRSCTAAPLGQAWPTLVTWPTSLRALRPARFLPEGEACRIPQGRRPCKWESFHGYKVFPVSHNWDRVRNRSVFTPALLGP